MIRLRAGIFCVLVACAAVVLLPVAVAAAAGWAPAPTDLVPPGSAGVAPTGLAVSAAGTITAEWLQGLGAADLMVADRPAGGPWGTPQRLSGGASVAGAAFAANVSGVQAASWLEGGYVRVATRAPGGAWEPVAVPLSGSTVSGTPVLTVAPDGTVAVAWIEGGAVKVSVRGAGAFSAAVTIPSGTSPASLAIASGPASDIMLAWTDTNGVPSRVMTAYRPAGGPAFQAPVAALGASPSAGQSLYLQATEVTFDPAGEIGLIWLRVVVDASTTTTHWEGKWRTAGPAGAFQGIVPHDFETRTVNSTLPMVLNSGVLTADASGRTSFVWPALAAGGGLDMATRTSGAGFGATQAVLPTGTAKLYAAAAGSNLLVADATVPAVAVAPPGAPLGAFDATPFPTVGTPSRTVVAGDASGDAGTLWTSKDGSTWYLRATVYDATPPEARDVAVPPTATAGDAAPFSVTPWDALTAATATWDFGDGTTATGASVQHAYATAGDRTVAVTVTDEGGNTVTATRTISVAAPPPAVLGPPPAVVPPSLTGVKLTRTRFAVARAATPLSGKALAAAARARRIARGTVVRWRLSEAATVRLTIATVPAHGKRSRVAGRLRRAAKAGASRLAFSGRVGRRALRPGAYRLTLTATDAAGHSSKSVVVRFRIVRAT